MPKELTILKYRAEKEVRLRLSPFGGGAQKERNEEHNDSFHDVAVGSAIPPYMMCKDLKYGGKTKSYTGGW